MKTTTGSKMVLKKRIVEATKLRTLAEKEKYYKELGKYDLTTLRKIIKFRNLVK